MATAIVAACSAMTFSVQAPVNTLPVRYASWNIDSSRDRLFFDVNLASTQLQSLATAMTGAGQSTLRFGGTGNDFLFYGGIGGSPACKATVPFSYECLNATLFDNMLSLSAASGAPIAFGINIHPATGKPSPPAGPWDPSNARFLLAEAQKRGNPLSELELGNEQNSAMTAKQQAAALTVLSGVLDELYGPGPSAGRPLLVGPDTHSLHDAFSPNGPLLAYLAEFATDTAALPLHAITHHEYIQIAYDNILNASFLDASILLGEQVVAAVRKVSRDVEIWAGEIGPHNGGGGGGPDPTPTNCADNRICGRYGSLLWYLDAMASKARAGYAKFCRQDAIGADYALLNATRAADGSWAFAPSPDFWALVLWHQLVAPGGAANVINVTAPGGRGAPLRAYAFCAAGAAAGAPQTTLLLINLDSEPACVAAPAFARNDAPMTLFALTPGSIGAGQTPVESPQVQLNGVTLALGADGKVPPLVGTALPLGASDVTLPPMSASFLVVPMAPRALPACTAA